MKDENVIYLAYGIYQTTKNLSEYLEHIKEMSFYNGGHNFALMWQAFDVVHDVGDINEK